MIVPLGEVDLSQVAHVHASALAGDFLPGLGEPFLQVFYRSTIEIGAAFGFAAMEGSRLQGFVMGTSDTHTLFRRVVWTAGLRLGWAALPAVLRRPQLLTRIAETFLYPSRESVTPETAELLVIAVDGDLRGRRIGEALVSRLNAEFIGLGIQVYKVTVLESNTGANRFYRRLGFQPAGEFMLYQKKWNVYHYNLELSL